MDIYKKGTQLGLLFATSKGNLSITQLWSCPRTVIADAIVSVEGILEKTIGSKEKLSFLSKTKKKTDPENELRFEILKDVYITKETEAEQATAAASKKQHNEKIMDLIQQKKEGALAEKSVEELEKMLMD